MAVAADAPASEEVQLAGGRVPVQRGGSGSLLVVIHDDIGSPGWLPFYAKLAEHHSVVVPTLPGWGKSDRPEWARDTRDIAIATRQVIEKLGITRAAVVGLGYGGWVAAEIATMCSGIFSELVLVAPTGILPTDGEYIDQFMVSATDYVRDGFHNQANFDALYGETPDLDLLETWEINREMATRVTWSPYMYSQTLPYLLGGVTAPVLLVKGAQDKVVPPAFSISTRRSCRMPASRRSRMPATISPSNSRTP